MQKQADATIKNGGSISQENYRALQREIINTENKLKQLKVEASGWTAVSKSLEAVSTKMTSLGSKISSVGSKMSIITAGLSAVGAVGVKSAIEQESAMQQVEKIYGKAADSIKNFAENTATAYNMSTKDAYKYSQVYGNLIQTITADEEENAKYTQELLKSSSVIASATGRTMEDVMDRIRSGLLGNTEAIEDLGVNVNVALLESTDTFKKFADNKSWNQLDFQTQQQIRLFGILEQTTKKYGTEVNQNTTTNVQELTAKLQNLGTSIGEKLLPYFNKIVDKATELIDRFTAINPKTQDLIIKIGILVAAIGPALLILGKLISTGGTIVGVCSKIAGLIAGLTSGTGALSAAITFITGPIGIAIASIGALIAVLVHLYNTNEEFRTKVQETWNNIVNLFQTYVMPVIEQIKTFIINVLKTIWGIIQEIWSVIEPFIQKAFETIMDWWNTTGSDIVATLMTVLGKIMEGINWLWKNVLDPVIKYLTAVLKPTVEAVFKVISIVISALLTTITNIWNGIKKVFEGLINFISGVFTGNWKKAWEGIKTYFSGIWNAIKGVVSTVWNAIKGIIETYINMVKTQITTVFTTIKTTIANIWNGITTNISNAVKNIKDRIVNNFQTAYNIITSLFKNIGSFFSNIWSNVKNTFSALGTKIGDAISGAVKSGINGVLSSIENTVNRFINMINGAIGVINAIPGVSISKLNRISIPKLAEGGIVDSATLAMIGEGKSAEAVIPLDRTLTNYMAEAMRQVGGTRNVTFNFYPKQMTEAELDRAFNYIDRRFGLAY